MVNTLLIVNVWALLAFCSFLGDVSVIVFFCVVVLFFFTVNVFCVCVCFLCAHQSRFIRFGFVVLRLFFLSSPVLVVFFIFVVLVAMNFDGAVHVPGASWLSSWLVRSISNLLYVAN